MDAPSLEAFKARLDVALGSLVRWLATLHIAGMLKLHDHCVPFQPRPFYDSMISLEVRPHRCCTQRGDCLPAAAGCTTDTSQERSWPWPPGHTAGLCSAGRQLTPPNPLLQHTVPTTLPQVFSMALRGGPGTLAGTMHPSTHSVLFPIPNADCCSREAHRVFCVVGSEHCVMAGDSYRARVTA